MADTSNLTQFLTDVASAIKEKTGKTDKIPAANFDTEIKAINTGGVKLFETQEQMQADPDAKEGDLAIVYRNEIQNMTADMKVSSITFPETVTLPTAFTSSARCELRTVDSSVMFDVTCQLDKSSFRFDGWSGYKMISASYTSTDGITYTRTRLQNHSGHLTNPVEVPACKVVKAEEWNDNLGYFIQVDGMCFEGLYAYSSNGWVLASTQLSVTSDYVYEKEFYGKNGVEVGTLQNKENLTKDGVKRRVDMWSNYNSGIVCPKDASNMFYNCTNLTEIPLLDTSRVTNMQNMFIRCTNLTTIPLLDTSRVTNMENMFNSCVNLATIPLLDTSRVTNMCYMFIRCTNLTTIPLLNTSRVTSMENMFSGCTSLTTIPLLDTSSVTSMRYMFIRCTNLTTIPQLDTSKVADIYGMFYNCTNLTEIPQLDTSRVTNMRNMFYGCTNLTTIPLLDTSIVTNMENMFSGCTSLSDDSLNNILAMCTNATKVTSDKTLKYLDLTSEQATKCTTLSNYQAFTNAGWTTGY